MDPTRARRSIWWRIPNQAIETPKVFFREGDDPSSALMGFYDQPALHIVAPNAKTPFPMRAASVLFLPYSGPDARARDSLALGSLEKMSGAVQADRKRGALIGLAIGDALGAPLEGLDLHQIRQHYGRVEAYVDGIAAWKRKPFRWRLPGLYTDDTQQALVLADVLVRHAQVDVDRIAELYLALATPRGGYLGAHRAVGRSFRHVIDMLENGHSPWECGQSSVGIGAAMRIAPVALYHLNDFDAIVSAIAAASLITHRDIRSLAAAAAVAFAIARLVEGEVPSGAFLLRLAGDVRRAESWFAKNAKVPIEGLDPYQHSISHVVASAERWIDRRREPALAAIVEEANRHGPELPIRRATQGFPPALIPTCLYLLCNASNFHDAVVDAVNLGGDADTCGAIVGALVGAELADSSLPDALRLGLQNRDGIAQWADALVNRSAQGIDLPDLVESERSLCEAEAAFRDSHAFRRGSGGYEAGIRG
jgi:ADP-ribosylglycohydrolase